MLGADCGIAIRTVKIQRLNGQAFEVTHKASRREIFVSSKEASYTEYEEVWVLRLPLPQFVMKFIFPTWVSASSTVRCIITELLKDQMHSCKCKCFEVFGDI